MQILDKLEHLVAQKNSQQNDKLAFLTNGKT